MMNDTHPEIERIQIELLRKMSPERRARIGSMLTNQSRWRSRQAIAQAHPYLSERQREFMLMELTYGKALATAVAEHIAQTSHAHAR